MQGETFYPERKVMVFKVGVSRCCLHTTARAGRLLSFLLWCQRLLHFPFFWRFQDLLDVWLLGCGTPLVLLLGCRDGLCGCGFPISSRAAHRTCRAL